MPTALGKIRQFRRNLAASYLKRKRRSIDDLKSRLAKVNRRRESLIEGWKAALHAKEAEKEPTAKAALQEQVRTLAVASKKVGWRRTRLQELLTAELKGRTNARDFARLIAGTRKKKQKKEIKK